MDKLNFYHEFENRFRGTRDLIKKRLRVYLDFIIPLKNLYNDCSALDLGCGRGEWLELLKESGFPAYGVDLDESMLNACRERDLKVEECDALEALKRIPDQSLTIVSGFHLAEHLPFDSLRSLVREALRVLKPAGLLILETPNPENISVGTSTFYLDPTHQRPIPPPLLSFLAEYTGFSRIKTLRLQENAQLITKGNVGLIEVFTGVSPDYAIIAQTNAPPSSMSAFSSAFQKDYGLTLDEISKHYDQTNQKLISRLEFDLARIESEAQAANARAQLAESEVETLQITLQRIYASLSWKITHPLRLIKYIIKKYIWRQIHDHYKSNPIKKKIFNATIFLFEKNQKSRTLIISLAKKLRLYKILAPIYWRAKQDINGCPHSDAEINNNLKTKTPQSIVLIRNIIHLTKQNNSNNSIIYTKTDPLQ